MRSIERLSQPQLPRSNAEIDILEFLGTETDSLLKAVGEALTIGRMGWKEVLAKHSVLYAFAGRNEMGLHSKFLSYTIAYPKAEIRIHDCLLLVRKLSTSALWKSAI